MRHWLLVVLLLPVIACGSPSAPSPQPVPLPQPSPAPPLAPIVQPDPARFDATFNAQLVHDALDSPTALKRSGLLPASPTIYLQSAGLSTATIAAMEAEARAVVPLFSGGRLSVAAFITTGADLHPLEVGAIVVELVNGPLQTPTACGQAIDGALAGHIWLNVDPTFRDPSRDGCFRPLQHVLGHELGHALGFWHVADPSCLMSVSRPLTHDGTPCDKERYHAGLAYQTNGAYSRPADARLLTVE